MNETPATKLFQNPRSRWLANALIFQLGWFICVMGGNIWAALFTAVALIIHVWMFGRADKTTLVVCLLLGWVHDNLLAVAGVLVFAGQGWSPLWLSCLWILMGTTLNHSLAWIYQRPWISAITGAVAGPLAYAGGMALSDAQWGVPLVPAFAIMALIWLMVLPSIRFLVHRIDSLCR